MYFVTTQNGDIFKLRFTAFESADGVFVFDKSLVFTSTDAVKNEISLVDLFPNPSAESVRVVWNASHQGVVTYGVSNSLGQRVVHEMGNATFGLNMHSIDVSRLPAGIYNLTVESTNGSATSRFVKH